MKHYVSKQYLSKTKVSSWQVMPQGSTMYQHSSCIKLSVSLAGFAQPQLHMMQM